MPSPSRDPTRTDRDMIITMVRHCSNIGFNRLAP